jgi:hypothetical protein
MPVLLNCSTCGHRRYVSEERLPYGIRCPRCDETFMDPIVPKIGQPVAGARRMAFKTRPAAATTGLIVLLCTGALTAVVCLILAVIGMASTGPMQSLAPWLLAAQGLLAAVDAGCVFALLLWRVWGFYGLAGSLGVSFLLVLTGGAVLLAAVVLILALAVIGGLYALLKAGKPSTWSQLE